MKKRFCVLILLSTCVVYGQNLLDKIVAIVDDDIILYSEVTQSAYLMAMQLGIDPQKTPDKFQKLEKQTLENLINQKLLLIQAEKDTIEANEREVDNYLEQQMASVIQQLGGEDKVEEYFGTTMSRIRRNYREDIEKNLRIQTVQQQKFANVKVTRREVEEFFKTNRDSIGKLPESVDLSHILIEPKAGEEAQKAALEKITAIRQQILDGADFAALAKENSEDPGSAARGGDLGFMARGGFVREFEKAAFALEPGEVSNIVKTQYGYHIIRLEEKRGEKIHTRHILITMKPTREDEIEAADKIKEVHSELENGADFVTLVEKYSQDASTREQQGHLGRFAIDELKQTAKEFVYAIEDVPVGGYSDPVRTQYGFHILKVNSRDKERELSLEKDWDRLEEMALNFKKQREFNKWVERIKQNVYIDIKDDYAI